MSALKILYVDDDDDIREVTELSLQMDEAMEVRTASSGADALAMLDRESWRPDVLLLDVMMPGMDGPMVLSTIRQRPDLAHAHAIFISARARPGEAERLRGLGAVGVIPKPFDPMGLAALVRGLVAAA